MKKKLITALLTGAMLSMAVCGSTSAMAMDANAYVKAEEKTVGTSETSTKETETAKAADYTLVDGVFTNSTFTMKVPEGWNIDEAFTTPEQIKFIHAEDKDSFDVFSNGSFEIRIVDFKVGQDDLPRLVENDAQFFKEGFTVEDITVGDYTGKNTCGMSKSYKDCSMEIAEIECWHEGTNDVSRGQIRMAYYTDEENKDIKDMLDSVKPLTDTANAAAAEEAKNAEAAGAIDLSGYVTITPPEGWTVEEQNDTSVKLKNSRFSSGYIKIYVCTFNSKTAEEWAEGKNKNFGGNHEILTREMCGKTFTGIRPVDTQDYFVTVLDGGVSVEISTMFFTLDQCEDLIKTIVIK